MTQLVKAYRKVKNNQRLNINDALTLAREADLNALGRLAQQVAIAKNGRRAAFLIDRNINYTNVCAARCSFCAFYRPLGHKQGYDLSFDEIDAKINETIHLGGHRILMQGGLHPEHTLETYEKLIAHIKTSHPDIHIHAFSPPEIYHVAKLGGHSYHTVLSRLKKAGLASIPGGGAEILTDRIRDRIAIGKCSAEEWLEVSKTAHQLGIPSTATMMMGHIETWEERLEHLEKYRALQDQTQGFLSFIPWTFQPENTPLHPKIKRNADVKLASEDEYLRLVALSRLYLDNFDHIQVSLLTQGSRIAQRGLNMGADDLGSLLIEENVVRLAGKDQEVDLKKEKMINLILDAQLECYERDTFYRPLATWTEKQIA